MTPTSLPAAAQTPAVLPSAPPATLPPTANSPPVVDLRFTPERDADGNITFRAPNIVRVNASRSVDPDGDLLYLTVAWGDGQSHHIKCGPCRLEHPYKRPGKYPLHAVVSDLKSEVVTKVTVVAQ